MKKKAMIGICVLLAIVLMKLLRFICVIFLESRSVNAQQRLSRLRLDPFCPLKTVVNAT